MNAIRRPSTPHHTHVAPRGIACMHGVTCTAGGSDILKEFPKIKLQFVQLLSTAPHNMAIAGGMDGVACTGDVTADGTFRLTLLYKADGKIDAVKFHAQCDGHPNIFVVIVAKDIASGKM